VPSSGASNKVFEHTTNAYIKGAGMLVAPFHPHHRHRRRGGRGRRALGRAAAAGFIPEEDQGILGVNVTLPPGASLERTSDVLARSRPSWARRRVSRRTRRSVATAP